MRQALGPGALGKPRGSRWRGRWEGGLGWGTHVDPWLFHSNVWQNSLQKIKKESWALRSWCFWTVMLEKTVESPSDYKEIQPAPPKGNQSWIFSGRSDAEAETPILWPPHAKNLLIWKDPDAGKDWRQEEKGTAEDEIIVWHHRFDGHEFEQALGFGDGQGGVVCCTPWGCKESDRSEGLNLNWLYSLFKIYAP